MLKDVQDAGQEVQHHFPAAFFFKPSTGRGSGEQAQAVPGEVVERLGGEDWIQGAPLLVRWSKSGFRMFDDRKSGKGLEDAGRQNRSTRKFGSEKW